METKVNLFFIGGMRCGSTSINLLLSQHPDVFMSPIKEPRYFEALYKEELASENKSDLSLQTRSQEFIQRGKHRTHETYQALFQNCNSEKYVGESSHYLYPSKASRIIKEYNPEAKILVCLREPTDRMFSEYKLLRRRGTIDKSFKEFIEDSYVKVNGQINETKGSRLNKGLYCNRLLDFKEHFGKDSIKIVLFENLIKDEKAVMKDVFTWLGLQNNVKIKKLHTQKGGKLRKIPLLHSLLNNKGRRKKILYFIPKAWRHKIRNILYYFMLKKDKIDETTERLLKTFYAEDRKQLEEHFGINLKQWD